MFCRKCGKELKDDWKICPGCGEPVMEETMEKTDQVKQEETKIPKQPEEEKKLKEKKKMGIGIGIGIVIAALVVGGSILAGKSKEKTENKKTDVKTTEKAKQDFSNKDFENLTGKSEGEVRKAGLVQKDGSDVYQALKGAVKVTIKDGKVDKIAIMSTAGKKAPLFHNVRIGMSEEEAGAALEDKYTEEQKIDNGIKKLNLEGKESVICELKDGKVSGITYQVLTEKDIQEYKNELAKEYVFPDSDKKYLSEDEIRSVDVNKMNIGKNEIYARRGYIFSDENLKTYFENTSWYKGTVTADQFKADVFNDFEKKNIELIQKVEDEVNGKNDSAGQNESNQEESNQGENNTEKEKAIKEAYDFLTGHTFQYEDTDFALEFQSSDSVVIRPGGEISDEYANYSITSRYDIYKFGEKAWLQFITIDGDEYYLRCFDNGSINLAGDGDLDGWYNMIS